MILVYLKHESRSCCTVKIASLMTWSKAKTPFVNCATFELMSLLGLFCSTKSCVCATPWSATIWQHSAFSRTYSWPLEQQICHHLHIFFSCLGNFNILDKGTVWSQKHNLNFNRIIDHRDTVIWQNRPYCTH